MEALLTIDTVDGESLSFVYPSRTAAEDALNSYLSSKGRFAKFGRGESARCIPKSHIDTFSVMEVLP